MEAAYRQKNETRRFKGQNRHQYSFDRKARKG
nr:MAG TPA: hypothetical protein [Caudoviricetes sp.]